jgi:hypothetical protein
MSIFDEVENRVTQSTSSGLSSLKGTIAGFSPLGAGTAVLKNAVGKIAPGASGVLDKALRGDLTGAAFDTVNKLTGNAISKLLTGDLTGDIAFNALPNPLLGGITPFEAAQMVTEIASTNYAKKNLYFIEITDYASPADDQNASGLLNMFCTSVSIGGGNVLGEAHGIGSAQMDILNGGERDEIRLTTYDDAYGQVKRWFNRRRSFAIHADGTFGLPTDYLLRIRILHAAVNDQVMAMFGGYEESYIVRPVSLETELSRTEDGLQEIQMSFSQFDTFMFNQG